MTSATIVFSFFILLAFLSGVKASIAGTHATCVYHHFFPGSNLEFRISQYAMYILGNSCTEDVAFILLLGN